MRICFELLEMFKAHKKGIRRATVNTFGYIAKAIGPQDVLATLLNNLKVQERQNRVCTTGTFGFDWQRQNRESKKSTQKKKQMKCLCADRCDVCCACVCARDVCSGYCNCG